MKKLPLTFATSFLMFLQSFAQPSAVIRAYIEQFKDIAMEEMLRTGVPASITLAQGIHETSAGQSVLVKKSNNHFGIKCKSEWKGPSVSHDDDARGECFRKYESPLDSYRDHSDFLAKRSHYAFLFNLDPADYEAWAWGLKKAGYATNPRYPQVLIQLIRDYNLQDYTLLALGKKQNSGDMWVRTETPAVEKQPTSKPVPQPRKASYPEGIFKINEAKVVFVHKGTSFLSVAYDYNVPLKRLFDFNDMQERETADQDQLIYIQRKRKAGEKEMHTVEEGETLHHIAQVEGIRLESLLAYNFLKPDMQPQAGERLYLKGQAPAMPRLMTSSAIISVVSRSAGMAKANYSSSASSYIMHEVQPKESMYSIAKKYSVTVEDIQQWNELMDTNIRTGQQLRIKRM